MALLCEYFTAGSNAEAAAVLERAAGPGGDAQGLPTLSLPGIEPTMWMGKLEELLTGRTFDEILADPTGKKVGSTGDEQVVLAMTDSLQEALATLPEDRIDAVVRQWAAPDEFYGIDGDPAVLGPALSALSALVRDGRAHSSRLYCWVSL